jgi:hypothetical protein
MPVDTESIVHVGQREGREIFDERVPTRFEKPLSKITCEHCASVAVRHLGAGRVDLTLSRDARNEVRDPFCIRTGIGKEVAVDAAGVVEQHLDGDPFSGMAIRDVESIRPSSTNCITSVGIQLL